MIAIIAAVAKNGVIGRQGKIPWDIPEDREHFKEITMGHVIVMGRRTFEEIGHALPGRKNYVVSSTMSSETGARDYDTAASLQEVIDREPHRDIFLCGGERLYREGMELADFIYLTELPVAVEGDTHFPAIPGEDFEESKRVFADTAAGEKICYVTFQRK